MDVSHHVAMLFPSDGKKRKSLGMEHLGKSAEVGLNYHHDTFETVFDTNLTQMFCKTWRTAALLVGKYSNCDLVHGPTADDYFAWQISLDMELQYVPKEKERVGWRRWMHPWSAHPPDPRPCAVYGQTQ